MQMDDQDDEEREDDKGVRRSDEVLRLLFESLRGKVEGKCLERLDCAERTMQKRPLQAPSIHIVSRTFRGRQCDSC